MDILDIHESAGGWSLRFSNGEIRQLNAYSSSELIGYTDDRIVLSDGDRVRVLDQRGTVVASISLNGSQRAERVSGNSIIIREATLISKYDLRGNRISSQSF